MLDRLAKLISVKTIVTFVVIAVFAVLSLQRVIPQDKVTDIVMIVIAFYFGTQTEKKGN